MADEFDGEFTISPDDVAAVGNVGAEAYRIYQQTELANRINRARLMNTYMLGNSSGMGSLLLIGLAVFLLMGGIDD